MSPKMKRNNGVQSFSPRNNWKSSSKWIGPISMSWLQSSKEDHPRMRDSNRPNLGTSMVPTTKRLWMLSLQKWRITYLGGIRLWSLLSPTWKAMSPHGGGQWDKRKGRTMVTLGNSLKNVSKPNLLQGILITFQGANSATLSMPQMTTYDNMWGLILNSC